MGVVEDCAVGNLGAIRQVCAADGLSVEQEVGEMDLAKRPFGVVKVGWFEHRQALPGDEIYPTVGSSQPGIGHILARRQAVAMHIAHELAVAALVFPYSHRRGTPEIAVVLHDYAAESLALHRLGIGEWDGLASADIQQEQSALGTQNHVSIDVSGEGGDGVACQEVVRKILKALCTGVKRRQSRRGAKPKHAIGRHQHAMNPVVAHKTLGVFGLIHVIMLDRLRGRIVHAKPLSKCGKV